MRPDQIKPMLAKLARDLPEGDFLYEPKWDGFRCIALVREGEVDLRSRHGRPLARYFPELVSALGSLGSTLVIDGEILVPSDEGYDFAALLQRLHPAASRVEHLSETTPAVYIAFDLLQEGPDDLTNNEFSVRRGRLEKALAKAPVQIRPTPTTTDVEVARAWLESSGAGGVDGVMAKERTAPYVFGKRRMLKVKRERTAECVVGAFRWHPDEDVVGSLLLGLYDGNVLRHAGLAASFSRDVRRELTEILVPLIAPLEGHPWERGFNIEGGPTGRLPGAASRWAYGRETTFVPVEPRLVCEVAYDHIEKDRFRHPPKFRRWRPDRIPESCTYDQFTGDVRAPAAELRAR